MIHQYKTNICSRPVPAVEFDNFLKARYEKQIIIQSETQPIQSKVQSFYQLLKLTKSGSNFTKQLIKKQQNTIVRNKTQSAKTINTFSQNNNNQYEFNRFEDIESEQAQMKKLNRMVYGLAQWQQDKARVSMYVDRKQQQGKVTTISKKKTAINDIGSKQQLPMQKIKSRKQLAYSSCDGKRFRNFYAPLKKHQASSQLNRINSQFTKTSPQINYPQTLLNCNFLAKKTNHFKQLKSKIKLLQNKAKNQYGLDFDNKGAKVKQFHFEKNSFYYDNSEEKQSGELTFSDLQLGPILAKESQQKYLFKTIKSGHKQNHLEDTSIPKVLIDGVIKNKTDSLHRIMSGNSRRKFDSAVGNNRDNLKKGYLSRPRTFKPSYMYVQI